MSSPPKPDGPEKHVAPLPPVEAPSASFLLQLFLIPLAIVILIVMVWLMFSWLAHMGTNPQDLVRGIGKLNDSSWQQAYNLAELLRKPQNDHLKDDSELAKELGATLDQLRTSRPQRKRETQSAATDQRKQQADATYENRIKLEVFLCHALGEFRVEDGLPALIAAAAPDEIGDPQSFVVRSAALQSIAVQASHLDPQKMQRNDELMDTVLEASKERGEGPDRLEYDRLRSAAAYTLGVIGGEPALDRLEQMLTDADPNVRYNAATGLARHGDARALPMLEEMLDPENEAAIEERDPSTPAAAVASGQAWKRVLVLTNGIRAARQLVEKNPQGDYRELIGWLQRLEKANINERVRLDAKELRLELERR